MEENMKELGVRFNCISLKPKSRPICAGNSFRRSVRSSFCQNSAGEKSHYAPCSNNYVDEEDTCRCSSDEENPVNSACDDNFDEIAEKNENYMDIGQRDEAPEKLLRNQYKSSHSPGESEHRRYHTQRRRNSRRECANKHRRNTLRAQLSHLLRKIKPTPENCVPDSTETRPEPEILAEVLLMSELEGADLSSLSPGNIFNKVFAESCDFTSGKEEDSSNPIHNSEDKRSHNKTGETISLIESNGEENIDAAVDDTLSYANEEYDGSTQYKSLPPTNKFPRNSQPLGYTTRVEISSGNLNVRQKNHRLPGEFEFTTRVQINGTAKPLWFPGYVLISSIQPNYLQITPNPEAALSEIWRLCRPHNILPASKLILE
ncbi:uncharacterized protein LOC135170609 isoform X2 [Diachasmimorpha longicaudata]|uniref:uncharacterized protein LOC135170609 isoform X2 n=1 Tax=Diachasmimorpha longicaudata TaxID=58733 RepID=UPI0030B8DB79